MKTAILSLCLLSLLVFVPSASAQKTEITISFSEQFFDALLDAVFQHSAPPQFSLSENRSPADDRSPTVYRSYGAALAPSELESECDQTITLLRETGGTRTAVRFVDGKIVAPLAFRGNYSPPLIGCVPFAGIAETVIELEFDRAAQRLIARAKVRDVSLNGTGGIGGSVIARLVQGSIDRKINPIEIIKTDKVSFVVPMQNSASIRMKATGFTHDLSNGLLNIRVGYEFTKN